MDAMRYQRQWRKNNPEKCKNQQLKYLYGISYDEWLKMWESQDGECAICGESFVKDSDAHVDHDHETGKIRGLLCGKCNRGIGMFDDDVYLLKKSIRYLSK